MFEMDGYDTLRKFIACFDGCEIRVSIYVQESELDWTEWVVGAMESLCCSAWSRFELRIGMAITARWFISFSLIKISDYDTITIPEIVLVLGIGIGIGIGIGLMRMDGYMKPER